MKKYITPEIESFSKNELAEMVEVGACSEYSCGCHSGNTNSGGGGDKENSCGCHTGTNNV